MNLRTDVLKIDNSVQILAVQCLETAVSNIPLCRGRDAGYPAPPAQKRGTGYFTTGNITEPK
jgi:hypothetical protein